MFERGAVQTGWRVLFQIGLGQVAVDAHGRFSRRVGPCPVIVVERKRFGDIDLVKPVRALGVRLPRTMRRLVVAHEKKRLVLRPVLQERDGKIRD